MFEEIYREVLDTIMSTKLNLIILIASLLVAIIFLFILIKHKEISFIKFSKYNLMLSGVLGIVLISLSVFTEASSMSILLTFMIMILPLLDIKVKNKIVKYIIIIVGLLSLIACSCLIQDAAYGVQNNKFAELEDLEIYLNALIYAVFISSILLLTSNLKLTTLLSYFVITLFNLINAFVINCRGTSIQINDFLILQTTLNVIGNYKFDITHGMTMAILISVFIMLLFGKAISIKFCKKSRHINRVLYFCIACTFITMIQPYNNCQALCENGIEPVAFVEHNHGAALNILSSIEFSKFDEPNNYDKTSKILSDYNNGESINIPELTYDTTLAVDATEHYNNAFGDYQIYKSLDFITSDIKKPQNIIVIMAESLCDIDESTYSRIQNKYLPFIDSLYKSDKCITGYTYTPVFGGGTADSEYEVLTGCTTSEFKSEFYAYQNYVRSDTSSIVRDFNNNGFETFGLHTYKSSGYNRANAYSFLGFDESYFDDNKYFKDADTIRGYIRDAEGFNFIKDNILNKDNPTFTFFVTMQGHGGYNIGFSDKDYETYPELLEEKAYFGATTSNTLDSKMADEVSEYATVQNLFDKDLNEFLNYIQNCGEDTLVVVFGDHRASLALNEEDEMVNSITPLIIWANYDLPKTPDNSKLITSTNYLGAIIEKMANINMCTKNKLILDTYEKLPVVCKGFYITHDNKIINDSIIKDSTMIDILNAITYESIRYNNKKMYW